MVIGHTEAGGGFMGIGPAKYCANLEKETGKTTLEMTDFFAGTSVGAINCGLYGCGYTAVDVLDFHVNHGKSIFSDTNLRYTLTKCGPRYNDRNILKLLKEKCGDRTMSETEKPLYITAWDARRKQLKVFGPGDTTVPVWYAIRCSMAAPTYFGTLDGTNFDGGVAVNDPLLVGMAGIIMDDSVDVSQGIKLFNLVTSGTNPERGLVGNDWFILTYLQKIILKALTSGNSSDVEFIRAAINKFIQKLTKSDKSMLQNFRVSPDCPDFELDDTKKSQAVAEIWTSQFANDHDQLIPYLLSR